ARTLLVISLIVGLFAALAGILMAPLPLSICLWIVFFSVSLVALSFLIFSHYFSNRIQHGLEKKIEMNEQTTIDYSERCNTLKSLRDDKSVRFRPLSISSQKKEELKRFFISDNPLLSFFKRLQNLSEKKTININVNTELAKILLNIGLSFSKSELEPLAGWVRDFFHIKTKDICALLLDTSEKELVDSQGVFRNKNFFEIYCVFIALIELQNEDSLNESSSMVFSKLLAERAIIKADTLYKSLGLEDPFTQCDSGCLNATAEVINTYLIGGLSFVELQQVKLNLRDKLLRESYLFSNEAKYKAVVEKHLQQNKLFHLFILKLFKRDSIHLFDSIPDPENEDSRGAIPVVPSTESSLEERVEKEQAYNSILDKGNKLGDLPVSNTFQKLMLFSSDRSAVIEDFSNAFVESSRVLAVCPCLLAAVLLNSDKLRKFLMEMATIFNAKYVSLSSILKFFDHMLRGYYYSAQVSNPTAFEEGLQFVEEQTGVSKEELLLLILEGKLLKSIFDETCKSSKQTK
ncbi:MAG: hypothetical protein RR733_03555, partial [Victivallaceae bacterium]